MLPKSVQVFFVVIILICLPVVDATLVGAICTNAVSAVWSCFLFHHEQKALVPLVQTCTHFGPILTRVWEHIDNTLRVAANLQGAWAIGSSQVTFSVRIGRQARKAIMRGRPPW